MNNEPSQADPTPTIDIARQVMAAEAQAILSAMELLDADFEQAVDQLFSCRGRVVVTGMGKMSCIARKAVATFCSTGTPAVFLHPGEAVHGDLGLVASDDVMVVLSNSGETREILGLMPFIKRFGVPCVAVTAGKQSSLAQRSQVVISTGVQDEVDSVVQAPTKSTSVTLAICDALAIALMHRRGFTQEQFAIFHPGGFLGSKMLLQVSDLMHQHQEIPAMKPEQSLQEGIDQMTAKKLGAVFVVDDQNRLQGVVTDGDLRRIIQNTVGQEVPLAKSIQQFMNPNPRSITSDALAAEAIRMMEDNGITVLPVIDEQAMLCGVIHLHDLIRAVWLNVKSGLTSSLA